MTSSPRASKVLAVCEPMKPATPVTRTFIATNLPIRDADPAVSFQNSQPGVACLDRQHLLEIVENTSRNKHGTQPSGTKPADLIVTHRENDRFEGTFRN